MSNRIELTRGRTSCVDCERGGVLKGAGDATAGVVGSGVGARTGSGDLRAGAGAGSGWGWGAEYVFVGVATAGDEGVIWGEGAAAAAPSSRLTYFSEAVLPEKNSPAVSAGFADGAGGKMSDWKESACKYHS